MKTKLMTSPMRTKLMTSLMKMKLMLTMGQMKSLSKARRTKNLSKASLTTTTMLLTRAAKTQLAIMKTATMAQPAVVLRCSRRRRSSLWSIPCLTLSTGVPSVRSLRKFPNPREPEAVTSRFECTWVWIQARMMTRNGIEIS
jgi:hypothetical protein